MLDKEIYIRSQYLRNVVIKNKLYFHYILGLKNLIWTKIKTVRLYQEYRGTEVQSFKTYCLEKSLKIRNLLKIVASEFYGAITESIIKRK